jgi:hypothetical protein
VRAEIGSAKLLAARWSPADRGLVLLVAAVNCARRWRLAAALIWGALLRPAALGGCQPLRAFPLAARGERYETRNGEGTAG